jgi:hypothetical protein
MYLATMLLFLVPTSLLGAAWANTRQQPQVAKQFDWRRCFLIAGLIAATVCVAADLTSWFSWFRNGGSPHGLLPRPGVWMQLRGVIKYSFIAAVVLAILGKGRGRLFALGSTASMILVEGALAALEMD